MTDITDMAARTPLGNIMLSFCSTSFSMPFPFAKQRMKMATAVTPSTRSCTGHCTVRDDPTSVNKKKKNQLLSEM